MELFFLFAITAAIAFVFIFRFTAVSAAFFEMSYQKKYCDHHNYKNNYILQHAASSKTKVKRLLFSIYS
jgi:hypothetical protein